MSTSETTQTPTPIRDTPTFLLATLLAARVSGDTGLEAVAARRLEALGITVQFVESSAPNPVQPRTRKRKEVRQ
jgi:hypothetical protein